ncbi:thiamine pyrophosphate-dependent dehydrogenase E1 component subunit alpha [Nocardioides sp.]|uniref:thiamine pyrophosphate-dependent dehydrogenase E1 component subunit alpha n=1 Tax=Nocardioides sp. TaxID=35761 RepID=UPI003D1410CE
MTKPNSPTAAMVELSREHQLHLFEVMHRIRAFENSGARALAQGLLSGTLHLSVGQEAVAAGVCDTLRTDDYVASTHRGHGHCLAKGADPRRMMAELFGAEDGYCRGRSGSMHIADSAVGILGANGIVGGGFGMATGAALSAQVRGTDQVSVVFFGEGAAGEGALHEALNLGALWRLPIVFVCENNGYAELSPISEVLATSRVADLAAPFGIPADTYDGNDVEIVVQQTLAALARARRGDGPSLLEFETYRQSGHFEGDGQRYRTKAERAAWAERDPLLMMRRRLGALGVTAGELDSIEAVAQTEMAGAVEWSAGRRPASEASLTEDVYADAGSNHG